MCKMFCFERIVQFFNPLDLVVTMSYILVFSSLNIDFFSTVEFLWRFSEVQGS